MTRAGVQRGQIGLRKCILLQLLMVAEVNGGIGKIFGKIGKTALGGLTGGGGNQGQPAAGAGGNGGNQGQTGPNQGQNGGNQGQNGGNQGQNGAGGAGNGNPGQQPDPNQAGNQQSGNSQMPGGMGGNSMNNNGAQNGGDTDMAQAGPQGGGGEKGWQQNLMQVMMAAMANGGGLQGILGKLGKQNQPSLPHESGNIQSGMSGGHSTHHNGVPIAPVQDTCWDDAPDCAEKSALCFNPDYLDLVRDKCQKTCGVCGGGQFLESL
ncbi:shK domain-like domain-containing protein [Ditylenchus destructor]|nr:shK domain-like domain-containing protein [Ditylenchus destructor]